MNIISQTYNTIGYFFSFLKRSNKTHWYAMVGVVGIDDEDTFAVIQSDDGPVTMSKSGTLYFYANDKNGRYFNNRGTLVLQITRDK